MQNKHLLVISSAPNVWPLKYSISADGDHQHDIRILAYNHDSKLIENEGVIQQGSILIISKISYSSDMLPGHLPYSFRAWFSDRKEPVIEIKNCIDCHIRLHESQDGSGVPFIDLLSDIVQLPDTNATIYIAPASHIVSIPDQPIDLSREALVGAQVDRPTRHQAVTSKDAIKPTTLLVIIMVICLLLLIWYYTYRIGH